MILLFAYILFLISMIIFIVFIAYLGFVQNNELIYFIFGLPFCFWILYGFLKWCSKLEIYDDYFVIKNLFFGKRNIYYDEFEYWKEIDVPRLPSNSILIKLKGKRKKISIIALFDIHNFEKLRTKLDYQFREKTIKL